MDTFKVGDLALMIESYFPEHIGREVTVVGPLAVRPAICGDGEPDDEAGYAVALGSGERIQCPPEYLIKITPPPDFVDEYERDELTA